MQRPQKYKATVVEIEKLNKNVYYLTFSLLKSKELFLTPGQRGLFNIGPKFNNYSITTIGNDHTKVNICVDVTPGGPGSKWIRERKVGDTIELIAPLGTFVLTNSLKPKIFLATGTGVSPFRPMIHTLLSQNFDKQIYLFFGERYEEDIFWKDQFESWEKKNKNFHYQIVLSRPSQNWKGKKGYIQNIMEEELLIEKKLSPKDFEYYICGNGKMISDSYDILAKYNINSAEIHTEKFYGETKTVVK